MKSNILLFSAVVLVQSCATPKYSYYFDHDQYRSRPEDNMRIRNTGPLTVNPGMLLAASEKSVAMAPVQTLAFARRLTPEPVQKETRMSSKRVERPLAGEQHKTLSVAPAQISPDKDLRLAAIFGGAGLLAMIIGGPPLNVIGGIFILVGLVFLVRWAVRR